ncbi:LytTR family DNA-binding domain-containing protein [Flammeovirgaceae bacterium SG7u.111]|nr:LytTR family DNA-binding domain-containing protein [Flammeovirgaceae bacterium SG7u.132]WPO36547.1 LytTR family DNA-binding domain-containing protein [Flammeovirgaceae bacterium SG7u.111]
MIDCIIVDDEPLALDILENYVGKTPFLNLKGRCNGVSSAMKLLEETHVDLLFLDIQMPDITGLEFSQMLGSDKKVIFTTAFEQYAIEGYKVKAIDYLLKPFNYQDFLSAATRAKEWFEMVQKANKGSAQENAGTTGNALFVKSEYKLLKIELDELLYVEGLKDYVKFYKADGSKPVLSLMSLKSLEEKLPQEQFMRVHRSFIVNLDKIETIQRNLILFDKISIPVAEKYKDAFQEYIKKKFLS